MRNINITEIKKAILDEISEENEEIFSTISRMVKGKLHGRSTLYLISGFLMLLDYLRFAPGESFFSEVRRSGMVGRLVKALGKDISLLDIFSGMILDKGIDLGLVKFKVKNRHLEKLKEISSKYRRYMEEMAKYCSENDLQPEEVLRDPQSHSAVIKNAWGSVKEYMEYELHLMEDFRNWVDEIENLIKLPLEPIAPMLIKARINRNPEELGLSEKAIEELVRIFKSLLSDVVLITNLFISEKKRVFEERMKAIINSG